MGFPLFRVSTVINVALRDTPIVINFTRRHERLKSAAAELKGKAQMITNWN